MLKVSWFKKRNLYSVGLILLSFLTLVSYQNCSALRSPNGSVNESALSAEASEADVLGKQAMDIIDTKCSSCHNPENPKGDISNITDLGYLLYTRLVIPGQPDISDLIRVIKEGTMPPGGHLSNEQVQALNKWILEGLVDSSGNIALPVGSAVLEPTYASIKTRILNTKCIGCHSVAGGNDGGVNLEAYAGLRANNNVVPGNPNGSRLITSMMRPGADFMPRGGARMTMEDINVIRQWIQNGALEN